MVLEIGNKIEQAKKKYCKWKMVTQTRKNINFPVTINSIGKMLVPIRPQLTPWHTMYVFLVIFQKYSEKPFEITISKG